MNTGLSQFHQISSVTSSVPFNSARKGGNFVIEVSENGGGLDRRLIIEPVFSTKAAGPGVGMDVVSKNIAAMGGRVEVASSVGATNLGDGYVAQIRDIAGMVHCAPAVANQLPMAAYA